MKNYIDNELNPSKKNFRDNTKEHYEESKSDDEILTSLEISNYEEAPSISEDNDFQIYYKKQPSSCFVKK